MTHLQHFDYSEFREYSQIMSPRLVVMLDVFRHLIESPIHISLHKDALGRRLGSASMSAHNLDAWDEVLAIDCFVGRVKTKQDVIDVVDCATMLGFTGIGIYPQWRNNEGDMQCGFHLDVRPSRSMGNPATWGRVNGKQISIKKALAIINDGNTYSVNTGRRV